MSERDEFEARVDDLVARSFVVTDGPRHPFSKGGETWAERDAVVRVVLADVASRAPQAVPALTGEQRKALEAAAYDYEERGYNRLPRVLRSILAAPQPSPEKAAEPVECRCTMTQKLVGDGCETCNPEPQ